MFAENAHQKFGDIATLIEAVVAVYSRRALGLCESV